MIYDSRIGRIRFFNHLPSRVAARDYSPTSAHELLMTAKQFITRLADMKLIPLPGNIRSRRFRFNHSAPAKIETFTAAEAKSLLATCDGFSERARVFCFTRSDPTTAASTG